MKHVLFLTMISGLFIGCGDAVEHPIETQQEALRLACGGFAGIQCPEGYRCVDDRSDNCDPANGGADCHGVCQRGGGGGNSNGQAGCEHKRNEYLVRGEAECAAVRFVCAEGEPFFDSCGCGCTDAEPVTCGATTCSTGEVCCNASCGVCTGPNEFCTQEYCGEPTAI